MLQRLLRFWWLMGNMKQKWSSWKWLWSLKNEQKENWCSQWHWCRQRKEEEGGESNSGHTRRTLNVQPVGGNMDDPTEPFKAVAPAAGWAIRCFHSPGPAHSGPFLPHEQSAQRGTPVFGMYILLGRIYKTPLLDWHKGALLLGLNTHSSKIQMIPHASELNNMKENRLYHCYQPHPSAPKTTDLE